MAAPLATAADVAATFRELNDSEAPRVDRLLRKASNFARSKVALIDERIAQGLLDEEVVADIVADMVIRVLRNEEGLKQETIGGVSATFDDRVASGFLFLTPDELVMLEPVKAKRASIGTINTNSRAARHGQYDPRRALRTGWQGFGRPL